MHHQLQSRLSDDDYTPALLFFNLHSLYRMLELVQLYIEQCYMKIVLQHFAMHHMFSLTIIYTLFEAKLWQTLIVSLEQLYFLSDCKCFSILLR